MPKLPATNPNGNTVDNTNKKIEQLEIEQEHLMNNIQMASDQLETSTS
jgi:hypothetical protein